MSLLEQLKSQMQLESSVISEGLYRLQLPLTLPANSQHLSVYLQDLGQERWRLSDNAELLFLAVGEGYKSSLKNVEALKLRIERLGAQLSNQGEIYLACDEPALPRMLPRFFDACLLLSQITAPQLEY